MSVATSRHPSLKRTVSGLASVPAPADKSIDFDNDTFQGFIRHPERFPLDFRRLKFWERLRATQCDQVANIGLTFHTPEYQKPGSLIEVTISVQNEIHQFTGRTVMVKEVENGYEIGIWLLDIKDAHRLRIVEQLCHIELYMNDKRHREGPFLSNEKITEEWITRFASQFPVN